MELSVVSGYVTVTKQHARFFEIARPRGCKKLGGSMLRSRLRQINYRRQTGVFRFSTTKIGNYRQAR